MGTFVDLRKRTEKKQDLIHFLLRQTLAKERDNRFFPPLWKGMYFLGSRRFGALLEELEFVILDIGARDGISGDLLPLALATRAIGFEPDAEECTRLNARVHERREGTWKKEEYLPVALASKAGKYRFRICKEPACSSLLEPNTTFNAAFGRQEDFKLEREIEITAMSLDEAAEKFRFPDVDFIKIDIQGAELDVLAGGAQLLGRSVLGVLAEVEFAPLYLQQPLFSEVEQSLRKSGFAFQDFLFERRWRRSKEVESGLRDPSAALPYSRGRLMHGDALFFRDWMKNGIEPDMGIERALKLAFLMMSYEFLDEAYALLEECRSRAAGRLSFDLEAELAIVSNCLADRQREKQRENFVRNLKKKIVRVIR